jgi:chromosome segregation ATPase
MNDESQNIEQKASTKTPNPEVVKAINALWSLLHHTAEKIDEYNEVKQQNIQYSRALEQMKSDSSFSSELMEEHKALERKYQDLLSIHIPEIERALNEERDRANNLATENEELKKRLEAEILISQNFEHAQKELSRKNHELNARADHIMKLKEEIANLESKVLDMNNKYSAALKKDSTIEDLNNKIEELNKEIQALTNEKDESNGVLEVLKTDLIEQEEQFSVKLGEISEKYNDLEKQFLELVNKYELLESEKEKLFLSLENFEKLNSELEQKNLEYAEAVKEHNDHIQKIESNNDKIVSALEEQIKLLDIERAENENQIRANLEIISKIEYKLNSIEPDYQKLKENLKECEECLERNEKALEKSKGLEKEIELARSELLIKESIIKGLKEKLADLDTLELKCKEYEKDSEIIKKDLDEKDIEIWNLNNELESLKNKSDHDKERLKEMALRADKLHQNITEKDSEIRASHEKISELKEIISEHEKSKTELESMRTLLLNKIDSHLPVLDVLLKDKE